ncbi:hypothetical protein VNI00_000201 [Paramarasmius palmivorus]|uniref:Uncharacterized protein n=1 Tax=Paramarasmius palmivorus TaxID=297713 RepID=A0AAW0EC58_9AGAR
MSAQDAKAPIALTSSKTVESIIDDIGAREVKDQVAKEPRVLVPDTGSQVLVDQTKRTVYYSQGDQALYAILEANLQKIEWELVFSRTNYTSTEEKHEVTTRTGLKVTNGTEASVSLNIGAAFEGLSIGFSGSYKTFTTTETTQEKEYKTTYTLPAGKSLYVYQRKYTFDERIWWILDAWNELWTVGQNKTYETVAANIILGIHTDEVLSSDIMLTEQASTHISPAAKTQSENAQTRRQFTNITQRAKDSINKVLDSA